MDILYWLGVFALNSLATVAFLIPLFQSIAFLFTGNWTPVSLIYLLQWLDVGWANEPRFLIGLHIILDWLHVSVTALLLTIPFLVLISVTDHKKYDILRERWERDNAAQKVAS